jgi:WbqC-like protein family
MIVAVHQPHFLPWLGYLDKMIRSDVFILLDDVQFERRNYQNRTQIRLDGQARWLTVPVLQHSQKERIVDKQIDNPSEAGARWWGPNHFQTLRHCYRHARFFELYAPRLRAMLETRWDRLIQLNQASLDFLRDVLDIQTPIVTSSELGVTGHKSELLINLCRAVGGSTYLAGMGGSRNYVDVEAFERAGIQVRWQEFRHPRYPQCGPEPFIPGLSAIDILLNCGPRSRDLLGSELPSAPQQDLQPAVAEA